MRVNADSAISWRCLTLLKTVVPYQYGQWVIEDRDNHDYLVISAVIPKGAQGYATAHRTGIIGQVFRTEKSILASDVRNHPLYDAFDDAIDWELSFPVFLDGNVEAVVNLEGGGPLEVGDEAWKRVCQVVEETTQCQPPRSIPDANNSSFIKTRRIVIRASSDDDRVSNIIEVARATARGGESTLLVGHYPDLLRGRGPTVAEASEQGLGVSYCFFGVEKRLDLLATGPGSDEVLRKHDDWWDHCAGRYELVLLNDR
jgi:hypothetical protein